MAVIPLTLTISLCLVLTFVLFFLREFTRHRFSSAESEMLLPLAEEQRRPATAGPIVLELKDRQPRRVRGCKHGGSDAGSAPRCPDCRNAHG